MAKIREIAGNDDCLDIIEVFYELVLQNSAGIGNSDDFLERTDTTITMAPGSLIYVGDRGYCTITANVRWGNDPDRKYGFLTCGHGIYTGDSVYYNDQYIGKVEHSIWDSEHDSGIIEQASPYIYVNGPARNGILFSYVGGHPEIDEDVWFSGGISASLTGKCVFSSTCATISGINMKGLIRTNCPTRSGDSGGMLFIMTDDGKYSFSATLVGGNSVNESYFMPYFTTRNYYREMYGHFSI